MAASLRELRERRKSVASTMQITKAMELIAASRVTKAQERAESSIEYTESLHRAVNAVASFADVRHPLTREAKGARRSAVLVISSDRGLAGGFPSAVTRAAEGLLQMLEGQGKEVDVYTTGRKAKDYFAYHGRPVVQSWEGFSEAPHYSHARDIGDVLISKFLRPESGGGVSELHVVYTYFHNLVSQEVRITRLLPIEIVEGEEDSAIFELNQKGHIPEYIFEPDAETVLDVLLPLYVLDTLKFMLRQSSASELAARQQAMHSATDNAKDLMKQLTREANTARQAEITQEINEIVGGAGALSESGQER